MTSQPAHSSPPSMHNKGHRNKIVCSRAFPGWAKVLLLQQVGKWQDKSENINIVKSGAAAHAYKMADK